MPTNVLIGALGDHPAVITCAVKALRQQRGIAIDRIHLLYPDNRVAMIGSRGFELVQEHLRRCTVQPEPLGFTDANSTATSVAFLRHATALIDGYAEQQDVAIYLLLAGGRKNMASLLALTAQFYDNVRGLYHLLDTREGQGINTFKSLEMIEAGTPQAEDEIRAALDQPAEFLNLFEIPYPGAFAQPATLRRALRALNEGGPHTETLALTPAAELFYGSILPTPGARPGGEPLDVRLSRTASDQLRAWETAEPALAAESLGLLDQMIDLRRLVHDSAPVRTFHVYRPQGSRVRPVFVTTPNAFQHHKTHAIRQVVVCALAIDQGRGELEPRASQIERSLDRTPAVRLSSLRSDEWVLIVPLGKSPMVATQTYRLLTESEAEGKPRVASVALVYPGWDAGIAQQDAPMLEACFAVRGVKVEHFAVEGCRDLDSTVACTAFYTALCSAIQTLRGAYPGRRIALSLSGGRKGMSVIALFAAQREGIGTLYHTLITDRALEQQIEAQTRRNELRSLDATARDRRLFLDEYGLAKFQLFSIPVIPVDAGARASSASGPGPR